MNLKQLQFVVHVAETHSFSRAAELSFATQPTLSNGISQLEDELGGRLFKRTTRMVELTPFGQYMLPRIKEILQNRDELLSAAESFHNPTHKILRIGFSPLVDMQYLDQMLQPFCQTFPDVQLFFKECFIDELSERMNKDQIDIQIVPRKAVEEPYACFPFYRDHLYYLPSSAQDHDSDRLSFELADLPNTPIIMTGGGCGLNGTLETLFSQQGHSLQPYRGQAMSYKVIEDWAFLGIGAGILPKAKISPDNKAALPLFLSKNKPAYFNFDWVWHDDSSMPEHIVAFTQYIQQLPECLKEQA